VLQLIASFILQLATQSLESMQLYDQVAAAVMLCRL